MSSQHFIKEATQCLEMEQQTGKKLMGKSKTSMQHGYRPECTYTHY